MSLQRSDTRKKKTLLDVQQGVKVITPDKADQIPDVDIVFVPGLGADPEKSWKSNTNDFNWISHKDGLVKDFPRARVLLYQYESSWTGPLKVKQFMHNIAMTLLMGLRGKREKCPQRPIVFIGHSMGGLVVAKAVIIADSRRDLFPKMFETIAGCAFFGTPFDGAPAAAAASMLATIGEKIDRSTSSKLLELMQPQPGNEPLRELKDDFMRLVGKLRQKIELYCFWEQHPTDIAVLGGLPSVFGLAIPKSISEFVSRESATLVGIDNMGLACIHRDLVKFDGPKDNRYQLVREPLKQIIHGAQLVVKNRFNSIRNIDPAMIKEVMHSLSGADVSRKRKALEAKYAASSWLTKEQEYQAWLARDQGTEESSEGYSDHCLWLRGPEGRGKTSGTIAVLNDIENSIRIEDEQPTGQAPTVLVYFFCDPAEDYCTAEDVLKSFLRQLVDQQPVLAPYAKHFVKKKGKDETSKSIPQLTVENMWQALQTMLCDEFIGSRVYFVVNNLHVLPEDADPTEKLMNFLRSELERVRAPTQNRVPVRWLFTSRQSYSIGEALKAKDTRLVDLEDEKYGNQVQLELRKHAHAKVSILREEKKYNKAVAYFAHSVIGKRAQNTQWIDIVCVQLKGLPDDSNDLKVRQILEAMPQDLTSLLDRAWQQIFDLNPHTMEMMKEMLRVLVLTFEDPTESELCVLSGSDASEEGKIELRHLVGLCKPLLIIKTTGQGAAKICFMNIVVKTHLLDHAKKILGLSEDATKWQHGVLAFRSFTHVVDQLNYPEPEKPLNDSADGEDDDAASGHESAEDSNSDGEDDDAETDDAISESDDDDDDWDEDESQQEVDEEAETIKDKALAYPVKYWLAHAGQATREIAEDLSEESEFWKSGSLIRRRWLIDYDRLTNEYEDFEVREFSALHVAAAAGLTQLVNALFKHGHEDELMLHDGLDNTPLHLAAHYGHCDTIEELLSRGARIDDGIEDGFQTPLHMAALQGNIKVMKKLINHGADINATTSADDIGPIVNGAIYSGSREAVKILVDKGVSLSVEGDDISPPLSLASMYSDIPMFDYLVQTCGHALSSQEFDKALITAAEAGRVEVLEKLLTYSHPQECFQKAIEAAADEENWDVVTIMLNKCQNLDCNEVFIQAAETTEQQEKVLRDIWRHTNGSLPVDTLNKALYFATDCEKESTVKLLLEEFGADPNATGEEYGNALTAAAYDGTIDIVEMLLDKGANVNDPAGWALQTSAAEGHQDVLQKLLQHGANVNAVTTNDNFPQGTALQAACEAGRVEIVELLLQHGADPNLGAGPNMYPLVAASIVGEEKIVELLVKANADVNVFGGPSSSTPLINAACFLPQESLHLLLEAGADINLADDDGDTALIVAASRGDDEVVQFLLEEGADIMHVNENGENALQAALDCDNEDCLRLLANHVSAILCGIKSAMDSGNTAVADVVREFRPSKTKVAFKEQEEEKQEGEDGEEEDKEQTTGEQQHEQHIPGATDPHLSDEKSGYEFNDAHIIPDRVPHYESEASFRPVNESTYYDSHLPHANLQELDGSAVVVQEPPRVQPEMEERPQRALSNTSEDWSSLFNQYPSRQMHPESKGTDVAKPLFLESGGRSASRETKAVSPQPIQQWVQQVEPETRDPALLSGQGQIRRKPAPAPSQSSLYDQQAQYSKSSSTSLSSSKIPASSPPIPMTHYQEPQSYHYKTSPQQQSPWQQSNDSNYTTSPPAPARPQFQPLNLTQSPPQQYDNTYNPQSQYQPQTYQTYKPLDQSAYRMHQQQPNLPPRQTQFPNQNPNQIPRQTSPPNGNGYYNEPYPPNNTQDPEAWRVGSSRPDLRQERSSFFGMKNLVKGVKGSFERRDSMGP